MSTGNFLSEARPPIDPPACHVCGAEMVATSWKCLSCGKTTSPSPAAPQVLTRPQLRRIIAAAIDAWDHRKCDHIVCDASTCEVGIKAAEDALRAAQNG